MGTRGMDVSWVRWYTRGATMGRVVQEGGATNSPVPQKKPQDVTNISVNFRVAISGVTVLNARTIIR